ncbi:MAG: DUF2194 domain-containing protein [Lachnospiraceae bacterium]|nr:DUF2194 domain-containing protein [Lachnospiraceae bacterium]MCI9675538.1 DUF2194 domain-containing protein [Lachnospiraceae bacterium]
MVSRRNFVTITLMILIIIFMFLFTGVVKQELNEYNVNDYEETYIMGMNATNMYRAGKEYSDILDTPRRYAVFVGTSLSPKIREVVSYWCTYTKRGFLECDSLAGYAIPEENLPEVVIIDGRFMDVDTELPIMRELTDRGVHLIFARMPHLAIMAESPELCEFLGIRGVQKREVLVDGVHLFEGFLLGGERIYATDMNDTDEQNLEMVVPWYMLDSGTKTYIMGMMDEEKYENENMPAILWRKSAGNAKVFCVNANYMLNMYGVGFLSAMMAEAESYEIYPVINAQCFTVAEFSGFSEDNTEELEELYSSAQPALYEGVIWPSLISVTEKTGARINLLTAPQLDYYDDKEPDSEILTRYLTLVKEEYGEVGVSMGRVSDISLEGKLARDYSFYVEGADGYTFISMYTEDLEEVMSAPWKRYYPHLRTIVTAPDDEEPIVDYLDRNIVMQRGTTYARDHTFGGNLAIMGYETALGYSNAVLDMKEVSYPETEEDYWQNLSREISRNLCTYWQDYEVFEQTTLTESDARVRKFLTLDYRAERTGDTIFLHINEFRDAAWFLLKINNGVPGKVRGGALQDMGGGYYLLEAAETEVEIEVESTVPELYR